MEKVAKNMENIIGARDYQLVVTLNHALAHIVAYLSGDRAEDHLAHCAWNVSATMHFEETRPDLLDLKLDDYK